MVDLQTPIKQFVSNSNQLVSFIIPSYNKGPYLKETIQSALTQDYQNLEFVIVNDGSTDNTNQVVNDLIRENPNKKIKLLEKPNGGISDARNFAIEKAEGRIIVCLDGDDIAMPTFVSKGMEAMRQAGAHLICCNVELFGAETGEWVPQNFDRYGIRFNNCIPTLVMYDRVLWHRLGGYSRAYPFNEDWHFFITATRLPIFVARINEKLFRYRVTTDGLAQNYIKDSWPRSVSLQITGNADLYAVEQVLWAHEQLAQMPDNWIQKIKKQSEMYPKEWLAKLWLGLVAEKNGNLEEAKKLYIDAHENSGRNNFQVMFRIALLLTNENPRQAAQLFHGVRTERPDMERFVAERIDRIAKGLNEQAPKPA